MSSFTPVSSGHPPGAPLRGSPDPSGRTFPALHRQLGLTDDEYERIRGVLGRDPSRAELAMYSLMWSEHCSYKSSKVHLRRLPTTGPRRGSTACSGWGMRPTTLPAGLVTPAMSAREPLGLWPGA